MCYVHVHVCQSGAGGVKGDKALYNSIITCAVVWQARQQNQQLHAATLVHVQNYVSACTHFIMEACISWSDRGSPSILHTCSNSSLLMYRSVVLVSADCRAVRRSLQREGESTCMYYVYTVKYNTIQCIASSIPSISYAYAVVIVYVICVGTWIWSIHISSGHPVQSSSVTVMVATIAPRILCPVSVSRVRSTIPEPAPSQVTCVCIGTQLHVYAVCYSCTDYITNASLHHYMYLPFPLPPLPPLSLSLPLSYLKVSYGSDPVFSGSPECSTVLILSTCAVAGPFSLASINWMFPWGKVSGWASM